MEAKIKASKLPHNPGVYMFLDENQKIIYIGKAKDLRKRVMSYFTKTPQDYKTQVLKKYIADIKFIVVETENDAFLLENTLIKQYKPKFNIQLKDDKSYPWIVIKNEPFPRIELTRELVKDGSEYYGPYTSVDIANFLLKIFKKVYKIRSCKLKLTDENIKKEKFKVCLDYHLGNCKAPCVGLQSKEHYNRNVDEIKKILKGKTSTVINMVKKQMKEYAQQLEFEKADELKNKLLLLEKYQNKSAVVNPSLKNIEVFSYNDDDKYAYINFLKIVEGKIIRAYSLEIKKRLHETKEEILSHAILHIRNEIQKGITNANEILVPFKINLNLKGVKITIPQKGEKKKLLELSERNLQYFKAEKIKERLNIDPNKNKIIALEEMKNLLKLKRTPIHIECFDNSNLQGSNPVSACVVFKFGRPQKNEYRKFNIKTVKGIDDFATIYEVVYRRYKRLLEENKPLPDLIIIDGGKGQLSYAYKALEALSLNEKIDIIAIAKRADEIFKPNEKYAYYIDKTSEALKIIQYARDEAHRFGITFHRQKRRKNFIKTELTTIKGIGNKSAEFLLKHFKSIEKIKLAKKEELEKIVGKAKTAIIYRYFHAKE